MSRIVFVLLVVLAVFSVSSSDQECGINEEFKSCGSPCEPTCDKPHITICSDHCVTGCQCKDGYVRNSTGTCICQIDC